MDKSEIIKLHNKNWYKKTYGALIAKWVYIKTHNLYSTDDSIIYEKHHIIPHCLGGGDEPENIVSVPLREHIILHQLLLCIYPDNWKVVFSANAMMSTRTGKLPNTRIAAWTRKLMSEYRKEHAEEILANARKVLKGRKRPEHELINISEGRIKAYKRKTREEILNMPGRNRRPHSEESKSAIAKKNKESWARKKQNNEKLKLHSRRIKINGTIYDSISEAARALKISNTTITTRLKTGKDGYECIDNNWSLKLKVQGPDGTIYESLADCHRKTGHTKNTIKKWINEMPQMGYKYVK